MRAAKALIGLAAGALALALIAYGAAADGARKQEPPVIAGTYAGEPTCVRCHFRHTRLWKLSGHVKATEEVQPLFRAEAKCMACHATGAGQPGGYASLAETPKLAGVQCEACHGPGAEHAAYAKAHEDRLDEDEVQRALHAFFRTDARLSCVRCHALETHRDHPTPEDLQIVTGTAKPR